VICLQAARQSRREWKREGYTMGEADGSRPPGLEEGEAGAKPSAQQPNAWGDATDLLPAKLDAARGTTQVNEGLTQPNRRLL